MTKEEVKNELYYMDSSIVEAIIECCKQLYCDGIPLWEWDYDTAMERLDKAIQDFED